MAEQLQQDQVRALIFSSFSPGKIEDVLQTARSEQEFRLMSGELCHLRADHLEAMEHFSHCITDENPAIRAISLWQYCGDAASIGDIPKFNQARKTLMEMKGNGEYEIIVKIAQTAESFIMQDFSEQKLEELWAMAGEDTWFPYRAYVVFLQSSQCLHLGKYQEVILLADTFSLLCPVNTFPLIWYAVLIGKAIACSALGQEEESKKVIRDVCRYLRADGLVSPLLLGTVIADSQTFATVKEEWPECARIMEKDFKVWFSNRIRARNEVNRNELSTVLTRREYDVALLVGQGLSNKQIAQRLDIAENTVRAILHYIFNKLQINSRRELLQYIYNSRDNYEMMFRK